MTKWTDRRTNPDRRVSWPDDVDEDRRTFPRRLADLNVTVAKLTDQCAYALSVRQSDISEDS